MKTAKMLNGEILKVTAAINEMYPELIKYMDEMPIKSSVAFIHGGDVDNMQDYYESLDTLLYTYTIDHLPLNSVYTRI